MNHSLTPQDQAPHQDNPVEQEILPPESAEGSAEEAFQAVFGGGGQRIYVRPLSPLTMILALVIVSLVIVAIVALLIGVVVLWVPVVLAGVAIVAIAGLWRRLLR